MGFSWCGTATMWTEPAGTRDTLASMAYGIDVLPLWVVVGLTPTDQASSAPEKDSMQAQVRPLPSRPYYQARPYVPPMYLSTM